MHWRDAEGASFATVARCVDISAAGMKLRLDKRVATGTIVQLECSELHMVGVAVVRHCRAKGLTYEAGIQFAGGLNWSGEATLKESGTVATG
jgi:hypothetical protein